MAQCNSYISAYQRRRIKFVVVVCTHFVIDVIRWNELLQEKEVFVLREDQLQANELRNELAKLRSAEHTSKLTAGRVEELESVVQRLTAELENERREKEHVISDRENIRREKEEVIWVI